MGNHRNQISTTSPIGTCIDQVPTKTSINIIYFFKANRTVGDFSVSPINTPSPSKKRVRKSNTTRERYKRKTSRNIIKASQNPVIIIAIPSVCVSLMCHARTRSFTFFISFSVQPRSLTCALELVPEESPRALLFCRLARRPVISVNQRSASV
jgi:hypothetical protein